MLAWRYEHRRRRREDLLHVFSFGSGRWPFPKLIVNISVVARPGLTPIGASPLYRYFLEDSESCFDNIFWLLLHGLFFSLAFWFRVHVSFSTSTCQFFLRVFFSTAHVCTCTQHDDTIRQEEYQSTSRLENADEKKFQQEEQSVQEELTPFPSSPAAFVSYLTPICHPGDSPVLCKTTQSW